MIVPETISQIFLLQKINLMMKKLHSLKEMIICLCLLCSVSTLRAQDLNLEWVRQVGGACWNGDEDDIAYSVTTDSSGNVYAAGYFCGTVDFDPGPGTVYHTTTGIYNPDLYIYKLSATGSLLWVRTIATDVGSWTKMAIAVDPAGNVFATGSYHSEVDFDPGVDSFKFSTQPSSENAYILKLDSAGTFEWAKTIGGGDDTRANGLDVAIDTAGNIFTTGRFSGTIDFNPGTGPADTLFVTAQGSYDIYISKLDASGNFAWARTFGSANDDQPIAIAVDVSGNVHTAGKFKGTIDFDPGAGIANLVSTGYHDAFISKLNNAGNFVWIKGFFADASVDQYSNVVATGICTDASGNVYTKGAFGGTVDFDPGSAVHNQVTPSANETYIFTSKLDSDGNFQWVNKVQGGWGVGADGALVLDAAGNIYMTGTFDGTSDFDPGPAVFNLTAANNDIYISKLTAAGNFMWAKKIGGGAYDRGYDIAVTPSGKNIYTAGSFAAINGGQADFDPGSGTLILASAGNSDGFIHKLSCNTYGNLTASGCDSFTFNGVTYTESGIYVAAVMPNATGCDSIITIDLALTHSTSSSTLESACDSFSINGQTYTTSGTYILETRTNAAGCDSFLLLDLTINTVNTGVTQNGITLSAGAAGASYQWIDCGNGNTAIAGAVQQTYTATNDGSYAVIITKEDCSDTSDCYTVSGTGIEDNVANSMIMAYPNPVTRVLTITTTETMYNADVTLSNIIGQAIIHRSGLTGTSTQLDLSACPAGTYILELHNRNSISRLKIVKE
jgi:hypothetical protein